MLFGGVPVARPRRAAPRARRPLLLLLGLLCILALLPTPGPATAASGDPDAFGYRYIDSGDPGGPTYDFEDISTTGTALALGDDEASSSIALGFDFEFYGAVYGAVYVSSNGFLAFVPPPNNLAALLNTFPDTSSPNGFIAAWGSDLHPGEGGTIHYQMLGAAPARRWILQFTAVPYYYDTSETVTFQIKLFESSNEFEVHYATLGTPPSDAVAGIEDATGTTGLEYARQDAPPAAGSAVRYIPPLYNLHLSVDRGYVGRDDEVLYTVAITNHTDDPLSNASVEGSFPLGVEFLGPVTVEPAGTPGTLAVDASQLPVLADGLTVPAHSTVTLRVPARVGAPAAPGDSLTTGVTFDHDDLAAPLSRSATVTVIPRFTVTSTADTIGGSCDPVNPADNADCTLRKAIMHANGAVGKAEIRLPAGTYALTLAGDGPSGGDLDISGNVIINGAGRDATIIQGNGSDRIFDISFSGSATISDLTIRGGHANSGGAIQSLGNLRLMNVAVRDNVADGRGGAIYNYAYTSATGRTTTIVGSHFEGNNAAEGGAIYVVDTTLTMSASTLDGNSAVRGGAILSNCSECGGETLVISGSTIENNTAVAAGGGVYNGANIVTEITGNTLVRNNQSNAAGGGLYNDGELTVQNSTIENNSASFGGAGIHSGNDADAVLQVEDSVVRNNVDSDGAATPVAGIRVMGGAATIARTALDGNDGLGIDRGDDGVTPNGTPGVPDFPTLVRASNYQEYTVVQGRVLATPGEIVTLDFFASENCDPSGHGEGAVYLDTIATRADPNGVASFLVSLAVVPENGWITVLAIYGDGETSEFSGCVRVQPSNDSWTTAYEIPLSESSFASDMLEGEVSHVLDRAYTSRWYKFSVQPGSQVQVTLSNLPANYNLVLYRDLAAAYEELSEPQDLEDLTLLTAEFAPDAYTPDQAAKDVYAPAQWAPAQWAPAQWAPAEWARDVFAPAQWAPAQWAPAQWAPAQWAPDMFAPAQWAPAQWAPAQWAPAQWAPAQWAPDMFAPAQWAPAQWAPAQWAPAQWAPAQWAPEQHAPAQWAPAQWAPEDWESINRVYTSAQTRSVLAASANPGSAAETVTVNTWDMTGDFYVRVSGQDGAFNVDAPFTVEVTMLTGACGDVSPALPASTTAPQTGRFDTLILTDMARLVGSQAEKDALLNKLAQVAGRSEVHGVIVDVGGDAAVSFANEQADANPACPYAKNLLANAIKEIVDGYRASGIEYVVLVGNDDVIPFFRYPDQAGLAPETEYVPPLLDESASHASLRLGYVLSQDAYGSRTSVTFKETELPIPELSVGRLVETPSDMMALLDAYLSDPDGVVEPASALVTGYDFLEDSAVAVLDELDAGLGTPQATTQLIAPYTAAPSAPESWSADQLRDVLIEQGRHDLIYLAGHFSGFSALAADFETRLLASEVAEVPDSELDLRNAVIFSAGCHSGYNTVNEHGVPGVTVEPDWAQAFARKGALLIAGTGYQYGDTDFIEYNERINLNFAQQLRVGSGPVSVGKALVATKQQYLAETPEMRGIHEKAYLQTTLFGLPMLRVNLPAGRTAPPGAAPLVTSVAPVPSGPGAQLELTYSDQTVTPELTTQTESLATTVNGTPSSVTLTYLEGPDGVVTNPLEPVLPLAQFNVGVPGTVLRGVGFRSGSYTDLANIIPLTGAPATELRSPVTSFSSSEFYPIVPWSVNYLGALAKPGNGPTTLSLMPAQYHSDAPDSVSGTLRRWESMDLRFFYSNNVTAYEVPAGKLSVPALAAPPTIVSVWSEATADETLRFDVTVLGAPTAGVHAVWVSYTAESAPFAGQWQSLDLTQREEDSRIWSGALDLERTSPGQIRYIVQAVNGVGLVSLDSNLGRYFSPGREAAPPTEKPAPTAAPVTLTIDADVPSSTLLGDTVEVAATLMSGDEPLVGEIVTFMLGPVTRQATTDSQGRATASLRVSGKAGASALQVTFNGTTAYRQVTQSQPVTINKQNTSLTLEPPSRTVARQHTTSVVATLRDSTGRPLPEKAVVFVVSSAGRTSSVTAITDYRGRAPLGRVPLPGGEYSVNASFAGTVSVGPFTLNLPDERYLASSATGTLVINTPPQARAGGPYTVAEGGEITLDGRASSDINGGTLTFFWDLGNDRLVDASSTTPTFSAADLDGPVSYAVTLKVCDSFDECTTDTTTLMVENVAPIVALGDVGEGLEGSQWMIAATVMDPAADRDPLTYEWSISRYDSTVASEPAREIVWTPPDNGEYILAYTVEDDDGGSTTVTQRLVVENVAPSITRVSAQAPFAQDDDATITVEATDPAGPDDPLLYEFDCYGNDENSQLQPNQSSNVGTGTCSFRRAGSYLVLVRVSDGDGGEALSSITVSVNNSAPRITELSATVIDEGSASTIRVVASDGSDDLEYAFDCDNDGAYEIPLQPEPGASCAFADNGTYTVGVQVSDGVEAATATVSVTVANAGPAVSLTADRLSALTGELVTFSGTWGDPAAQHDNDYAWAWDFNNDGTADRQGRAAHGTTLSEGTSFAEPGTYTVKLDVTDKDGGVGSQTMQVQVRNRNNAPLCASAAPSSTSLSPTNHQFETIWIQGVTDPDGDNIAIRITGIRQDEAVNEPGSGNTSPDGTGVGTSQAGVRVERSGKGDGRVYHIAFRASDGQGASCSGTVTVEVRHNPRLPAVDGGPLYDSTAQ